MLPKTNTRGQAITCCGYQGPSLTELRLGGRRAGRIGSAGSSGSSGAGWAVGMSLLVLSDNLGDLTAILEVLPPYYAGAVDHHLADRCINLTDQRLQGGSRRIGRRATRGEVVNVLHDHIITTDRSYVAKVQLIRRAGSGDIDVDCLDVTAINEFNFVTSITIGDQKNHRS